MQIIIPAQLSGIIKKLTKGQEEKVHKIAHGLRAVGSEHSVFSFDITWGMVGDEEFGCILRVGILATLTEQHSF